MRATTDTCPTCGDTAEWCSTFRKAREEAGVRKVRVRTMPRKRASKAQALVDFGLASSLAEAREQLRDMGD